MGKKVQITEYLDIDLEKEMWCCNRCKRELIGVKENWKKGCRVYERDPRTIYDPVTEDGMFAPDPSLCAIIEFYCPGCGSMLDNEVLPLGHPVTHDIELDVHKLKKRYLHSA